MSWPLQIRDFGQFRNIFEIVFHSIQPKWLMVSLISQTRFASTDFSPFTFSSLLFLYCFCNFYHLKIFTLFQRIFLRFSSSIFIDRLSIFDQLLFTLFINFPFDFYLIFIAFSFQKISKFSTFFTIGPLFSFSFFPFLFL